MNAKEKKSLEILFSFVKGNYKEILEEEFLMYHTKILMQNSCQNPEEKQPLS